MYQLKSKVRFSEAMNGRNMSYHALFNYLQDTSTFHSEELGESGADLKAEGYAWILSFWQVCIDKMPKLSEDIVVSTWPYSTQGLFGCRNFCVDDEEGTRLIKANSIWVLVDVKTGRPVRITDEVASHYPDEEKLDMNYCDRKIAIPAEYEEKESVVVTKYFIDVNNHMNNAKYIMVAEQYLPETLQVSEIRVEYKKAAMLGAMLYPRVTITDNAVTVVTADENGKAYATVQFIIKKEVKNETR